MGGEKQMEQGAGRLWVGSPPRGRGKVSKGIKPSDERGITPAWAGKRQTAAMPRTMTRVHPRMGREKTMYFEDKYFCRGSPPHGRGKAEQQAYEQLQSGITPAWAGKSPASQPWSPPLWMMVIRPRP